MNVPNTLTLLRLACLPATIALYRCGRPVWAAALFLAIMLADCVDGWLARRLGQQTWLGTFLDPVTDKIVMVAIFYELARANMMPLAVPHLLLARELFQNAVRDVAAARGKVVGANWMGKTKAILQTSVVIWGLLLPVVADRLSDAAASALRVAFGAAAWGVVGLAWVFFAVFVSWNRSIFAPRAMGQ
jgi:CDP-diacylglycerol--glycerol-3-phosphate 3-phosphatidyltransferase